MSKYSVQYVSSSKGAMNLEDMATQHLRNALAKMEREGRGDRDPLMAAMRTELDERDRVAREQAHEEALAEGEPLPGDEEVSP